MYETELREGVFHYRSWAAGGRPTISRVLLMNLGHIGDFWMTLPALREARHLFQKAHITLVVGGWNETAAIMTGLADEVIAIDYFPENNKRRNNTKMPPDKARELASSIPAVDVAIDLRVSEDTRFVLTAIRAKHRCAFTKAASEAIDIRLKPTPVRLRPNKFVRLLWRVGFPVWIARPQTPHVSLLSHCALEAVKAVHHTYTTLHLSSETASHPTDLPILSYDTTAAKHISVVPFSNSKLRDWPIERYRDLVQRLLRDTSQDIHFVFDSKRTSPAEAEAVDNVREFFSAQPRFKLKGNLTRDEFISELATASMVISNNSGAGHISAQLGVPTVGIYTASHHPLVWGFVGPKVSLLCGDVKCSACGIDFVETRCPFGVKCRSMITTDLVHQETLRLLNRTA